MRRLAAVALAVALVAGACGGDDSDDVASATATLAMRGLVAPPRAVARIVDRATDLEEAPPRVAAINVEARSGENWNRVIGAMVDVVHGARGTARKISQGATYRMAGKTGTAQVFGIGQEEEYDEDKIAKNEEKYPVEKAKGRSTKYTDL